jgi:hypothetical protein
MREPVTFSRVVIGLTQMAMMGACYIVLSPIILPVLAISWIKSKVRPEPIYPKRGLVRPLSFRRHAASMPSGAPVSQSLSGWADKP